MFSYILPTYHRAVNILNSTFLMDYLVGCSYCRNLLCSIILHHPLTNPIQMHILQHGFPHHLAVAMTNITREIQEACALLGVEYFGVE